MASDQQELNVKPESTTEKHGENAGHRTRGTWANGADGPAKGSTEAAGTSATPPLAHIIKTRFPNSRFNLHQLAGHLHKRGIVADDEKLAILARVYRYQYRIKSPWAYITSTGLLGSALSDAVEGRANNIKANEAEELKRGRGMRRIGKIMRDMPT